MIDCANWDEVGVGRINAVSGRDWELELHDDPQDYIVCSDQPWLDGINAGAGSIRQFVAMPLGLGYTVEAQLSGKEEYGGIQIAVFDPKAGSFPESPPAPDFNSESTEGLESVAAGEMGLGAGARIKQKIYPDPYGVDTWNREECGSVFVHIVNSEQYEQITGFAPPPTPVSAESYAEHGLPWFGLYDDTRGDIAPPDRLKVTKTISQRDAEQGGELETNSISIQDQSVKKLIPGGPDRGK